MTESDQRLLASFVFALMVIICAAGARAEDSPRIWLARAFVSECGWEITDCQAAVAHTLSRRARRRRASLLKVTRQYCAGLGWKPPKGRQVWIRAMDGDEEPAGWPRASWRRHLPRWKAAKRLARRFLAGKVPDPCKEPSYHFGGLKLAIDVARMKGREPVDCGNTGNQGFWR